MTPFEHNSFRFHIRTPIFVAREWFRHRIGCLTGDAVVTFVDINGNTSPKLSKTMDELWQMWSLGEVDGHALTPDEKARIDQLSTQGKSFRTISNEVGRGRRAISRYLNGEATGYRSARSRIRNMRLRVANEETGEFEVGHIVDVIDKGPQPVYRLTLADGKQLTATENHQLLTDEGWRTLRNAVGLVGAGEGAQMTRSCHLMTNGVRPHMDYAWMRKQREAGLSVQEIADLAGCSYHNIRRWLKKHELTFRPEERNFAKGHRPWNKDNKGYKLNRTWTEEQKDAIRRARSGPKSNFWRGGITPERANIGRWTREQAPRVHHHFDYTCQQCGKRGGTLHAHHIVPVWMDASLAREITNLVSVCDECHKEIHRTQLEEYTFACEFSYLIGRAVDLPYPPSRKGVKKVMHPVAVVTVEYVGIRQTYDLCVEGPWHNFVANGVVVHNSFNEESARYHKMSDDFYIPDVAAVRSQVGKPGSYSFEPVDEALASETRETLERLYKEQYAAYQEMIEKGVAKEVARAILPVGIFTQFYWTINARALMNFLSLRNAQTAQYEIRMYAEAIERLFAQQMPITHQVFVEFGRVAP